jgi:transposase-like protein
MKQQCPYCNSENVLPFEEEGGDPGNQTFITILLSALAILGTYFLFLMISYINYPMMIIIIIGAISYIMSRQDRKKKKKIKIQADKDYICLDCNSQFTLTVER